MPIIRNIFIILFVFQFAQQECYAQSDVQLKYWQYKQRLLEYFMFSRADLCVYNYGIQTTGISKEAEKDKLYKGLGLNLPASDIRHHNFDKPQRDNYMKWGDATSYLGFYISLLATEYEVLRRSGGDTYPTIIELYKALKSFERLDLNAEIFYNVNFDPNPNGFFLRDDVYGDLTNYHRLNNEYRFRLDPTNGPSNPLWVDSDFRLDDEKPDNAGNATAPRDGYCSKGLGDNNISNAPSGDQITYLLMGFALVHKFLPEESINIGQCLETKDGFITFNFRSAVRFYTDKILIYLKGNGWKGKFPNGQTLNTTYNNATPNSYGLAMMGNYILGQKRKYNDPTTYGFYWAFWSHEPLHFKGARCEDSRIYHTSAGSFSFTPSFLVPIGLPGSLIFSAITGVGVGLANQYVPGQIFNRSMNMAEAAVGNSWDRLIYECNPKWYEWLFMWVLEPLQAVTALGCGGTTECNKNTRSTLDHMSQKWYTPLYTMLYRVLRDDYRPIVTRDQNFVRSALLSAPCHGPACEATEPDPTFVNGNISGTPVYTANAPWRGSNIHQYIHTEIPGNFRGCSDGAAFNGIDFMLLFNMWALLPYNTANSASKLNTDLFKYPKTFQRVYHNPTIKGLKINSSTTDFGGDPLRFYGIYQLNLNYVKVSRTVPVDFIGEEEVVLQDETDLLAGSEVTVRIGKMPCNSQEQPFPQAFRKTDEDGNEVFDPVLPEDWDTLSVSHTETISPPIREILDSIGIVLALYPNPITGTNPILHLGFYTSKETQDVQLEIFSTEMRKVGEATLSQFLPNEPNEATLDLAPFHLSAGLYTLCMTHGGKRTSSRFVYQP